MTLGDGLIHSVLIIGSVRRERCDWIADLVEQCASSRGVIDVFFRQFDRDNFTASGIDADMQLTPGPATRRAVLFNQPFTGAAEFKASAVDEEMERTGFGPVKRRQNQRLAPAAHRRMRDRPEPGGLTPLTGTDGGPTVPRQRDPAQVSRWRSRSEPSASDERLLVTSAYAASRSSGDATAIAPYFP